MDIPLDTRASPSRPGTTITLHAGAKWPLSARQGSTFLILCASAHCLSGKSGFSARIRRFSFYENRLRQSFRADEYGARLSSIGRAIHRADQHAQPLLFQ
ncbi:hypothetical protein [Burkholderia sp. S-53]|uniref:hypothetical protein n=1 Tax=Burkholderia sp. S-53 TaxID=2906514 RepID=UPI0021D0500D|nr:hypothetical protein [Burkholderia sp. S-53]UXU91353.1 hypothetical protein LXM88_24605 [Burkholderia sp. S-53]